MQGLGESLTASRPSSGEKIESERVKVKVVGNPGQRILAMSVVC
jgi:hypothetical protein